MAWLIQVALCNAVTVVGLAGLLRLAVPWIRRPALAHTLWVLVLVKLLTPPLFWIPVPFEVQLINASTSRIEGPANQVSRIDIPRTQNASATVLLTQATNIRNRNDAISSPLEASGPPQPVLLTVSVPNVLLQAAQHSALPWLWKVTLCVWLFGCLWRIVLDLWRLRRFYAQVSRLHGTPSSQQNCTSIARKFGLSTAPPLVFFDGVCTPMLWGIGPWLRIVFPRALWDSLPPAERTTLLTHELAHYARGDHYVRLLEMLARAIFWWHPAVYWAQKEIEAAEEECCDAWVVHHLQCQTRTYAEALLCTLDFISDDKLSVIPAGSGVRPIPMLERRLTQIMRRSGHRTHSACGLAVAGCVGLFVLLLSPFVQWEPASLHAAPEAPIPPSTTQKLLETAPDSIASREAIQSLIPSATKNLDMDIPILPSRRPKSLPRARWGTVASSSGAYRLHTESQGRVFLENRRERQSHNLSEARLTSAAFLPDSDRFLAGTRDGLLQFWDSATGNPLRVLGRIDGEITSISINFLGDMAVCTGANGTVTTWDVESGRMLQSSIFQEPVVVSRFSQSGKRIAIVTGDWTHSQESRLLLLDAATLEPIASLPIQNPAAAIDVVGESEVLVADQDGFVIACDMLSGKSRAAGMVKRQILQSSSFSQNLRLSDQLSTLKVSAESRIRDAGEPMQDQQPML